MTSKIGIGIDAKLDTSSVEQQINALGQKIAAQNRVQYSPVSVKSIEDVRKLNAALQEVYKTQAGLRQRLKATGQENTSFADWDWKRMYPHAASRAIAQQSVFTRVVGAQPFSGGGGAGGKPPSPPTDQPSRPGDGSLPGTVASVAQAGLRATGPAGGVVANSIGAGMSGGFGAGMMGLMGGMLALGVGKLVSGVMEKIEQAEGSNIALDRLKRTLGDVNVSFDALKSVVRDGADNLKITYAESEQLATQFAKLGNLSGAQYRDLAEELDVGVGVSRSFGLDPAQGVGVMGQMRGIGVTSNTQDSRRFALLIGETIGKSGAFAKADEVMEALASFAASQTRNNMSAANVSGYAGMLSGMVGSGIPGLDPQGAAGMLARINSSLSAGGAKGEASQFFTALVGNDLGLDPIQTQILREGGAFATNKDMFGRGSAYRRYMGEEGPGGDKTVLQATLERLNKQRFASDERQDKLLRAQAASNHLGVNVSQAMALLSVKPNQMGELQERFGDLSKLSANGIGNLSKAMYGTAAERQSIARDLLGRKGNAAISEDDRKKIESAQGDDSKLMTLLGELSVKYGQEETTGSIARDSKALLDNIKVAIADRLVPMTNEMRLGILSIAGVGQHGKTTQDILRSVVNADFDERAGRVNASYDAKVAALEKQRGFHTGQITESGLIETAARMTGNSAVAKSAAESARGHKERVAELDKQIAALREEQRKKIEAENAARQREIEQIDRDVQQRKDAEQQMRDAEKKREEAGNAAREGRADLIGAAPSSAGAGTAPANQSISRRRASGAFDDLFVKYGKMYGVDPALLKTIAMKESGLNPDAVGGLNDNGTRDYGLMQHNSKFLAERGLDNGGWKNPERSVEEAAKLLRKNIERAGSVRGGVRMYNGTGPKAEAYADDVMSRLGGTRVGAPAVTSAGQGTPLPGGDRDAREQQSQRVILDAQPLEVIHRNERGEVMKTERLSFEWRRASPFGTERYA